MSKKIIGLIVAVMATVIVVTNIFLQTPVDNGQAVGNSPKVESRSAVQHGAPVVSQSTQPEQKISQPAIKKRTHPLMKGLRLIGISENVENQKKSYAMMEVDGQQYITVYIGKEVKPGVTLAEIKSSYIMVSIEQQLYQLDFSNVPQPDNAQMPMMNDRQQPTDYHQSVTPQSGTYYRQSKSYSNNQSSTFYRHPSPVIDYDSKSDKSDSTEGSAYVGGGIGSQVIQLDSTSSQTTTVISTTPSSSSSTTTTESSATEEKRPDFMIDPGTMSDEVPASVEGGDVAVPESDVPLFMIDPPPPAN